MKLSPESVRGRQERGEEGVSGEFLSEGVCVCVCRCAEGGVKSHLSTQTPRVFVCAALAIHFDSVVYGKSRRARTQLSPLSQHPIGGEAGAAPLSARSSAERETPLLPLYPHKSIAMARPDKPDY